MWKLAMILAAAISATGCADKTVTVLNKSFSRDLQLRMTRSSYPGQLGDVEYRVAYVDDGQLIEFFRGVNPRAFSVEEKDQVIVIKFCKGSLRLAEPIFRRSPRPQLIDVDVRLSC